MTQVMNLVAAFAALVAHEIGHYIAARSQHLAVSQVTIGVGPIVLRFGRACRWRIRLLPLLAHTQYSEMSALPARKRAAILMAGPAGNGLFGAALLAVAGFEWHEILPRHEELFQPGAMPVLWLFGAMSLAVGAFNLLPVPPLDGGALALLVYEKIKRRPRRGSAP